ncbi:MAG: hypothetical protein Phog2KO_00070 [Phototrophicaceae bacterium]
MDNWSWINSSPKTWTFLGRVILKALLLFGLCNLVFAWIYPLEFLGRLSFYGTIYPARSRLPYSENPPDSYNVSLDNISALFASHDISIPPADDEFRVILIGDSNTWGWLLNHDETLSATINNANIDINGQTVLAYNLGYPVMSLSKDLLILDEALNYQPDMIIWLVSLESFAPEQQLDSPLAQNNFTRLSLLIEQYELNIDLNDSRFIQPNFWERSIIGQRRNLADLLRLQNYGLSWSATGIDQVIPETIPLRESDFEEDYAWYGFDEQSSLSENNLAFDVLQAGIEHTGDSPILIINEPIFISEGMNSDIRYNSFYPRWVYDDYRALLQGTADDNQWLYLDLWDRIPAQEFTDSPLHLSTIGTEQLAEIIVDVIVNLEE